MVSAVLMFKMHIQQRKKNANYGLTFFDWKCKITTDRDSKYVFTYKIVFGLSIIRKCNWKCNNIINMYIYSCLCTKTYDRTEQHSEVFDAWKYVK